MTRKEAATIAAFTGVLIGKFGDMHQYIEEKLGRPVFTCELGSDSVIQEIKEATKDDFVEIHENLTD